MIFHGFGDGDKLVEMNENKTAECCTVIKLLFVAVLLYAVCQVS